MTTDFQGYAATILQGEKIRLRPLWEEDLLELASWWNDPAWMVFQSANIAPSPDTSTMDMFRTWSSNKDTGSFGFSIEEIESRKLVGHVTLWGIDPVVRAGTLGIIIGGKYVDRGFGTDVMRVILRFAFEELGINKVELSVWEYNTRGLKTYERVGFVVEGTRRAATFHAGQYWAQIQMGILKSEYLETH